MRALVAIAVLVLALPYEPIDPWFEIFGLEISHLEAMAFVLFAVAACSLRWREITSLPLAAPALALLVAVFVSAVLADGPWVPPLKFALRWTAGLVAFVLTSLALAQSPRFALVSLAFAAAGATTAALGLGEAVGVSGIEHLVAPFREHAFEVGGRHRAGATFSYPNTAGGFLALTLPFAMSFVARHSCRGVGALGFVASVGIFGALLVTYSRGALLGAIAAAVVFTVVVYRADPTTIRPLVRLHGTFLIVAVGVVLVDPSFRWRASSESDRSWYVAEIKPASEVLELSSGELTKTPVRVTNAGKLTWRSEGEKPIHLSYRWFRYRTDGSLAPVPIEGERTRLPSPLSPGDSRELSAKVRAPEKPGRFVLVWDMVHEHTTWFSDKVGLGMPVHVGVDASVASRSFRAAELKKTMAERAWRPGRRELWTLAIAMFVERPLLGVGPDNFRWTYGARAGRDVWDTRVFANSLYLELLSTIGAIGFGAFAVLVSRALVGLRRTSRAPALDVAAIAASLTGFLVHGLFDYLLAFTPMYLAFFVLLGAASAVRREEASS